MKLSIELKFEMLKTAMQEDRNEIRLIKGQIYNVCSFLTVSSFAVTSFLIGDLDKLGSNANGFLFLLIDVSFIALLWTLFARLKTDLTNARKCLQVREGMIRKLNEPDEESFDPFPDASKVKLTITENGLYWLAGLATCALVVKLMLVCFAFAG